MSQKIKDLLRKFSRSCVCRRRWVVNSVSLPPAYLRTHKEILRGNRHLKKEINAMQNGCTKN